MIKQPESLGIGLQKYIDDEDTKDPRTTIELLEKTITTIQPNCHGSVLDVGCGNGRLNSIFTKYFDTIIGIDKFRNPNSKYVCSKYEFKSIDIFDVKNEFDLIVFMGSFYLHYCYGYSETLIQASKLLKKDGRILIADDKVRNTKDESNQPGYYNLDKLCQENKLKIFDSLIHENYLLFSSIGKE